MRSTDYKEIYSYPSVVHPDDKFVVMDAGNNELGFFTYDHRKRQIVAAILPIFFVKELANDLNEWYEKSMKGEGYNE